MRDCILRLSLFAFVLAPAIGTAADKPNILFLFADDQCYETVHAHGNEEIETPNLDRLAARGLTFSRAYNQGSWSGAVCVASRAMLNTGRFLWHANAVARKNEQERQAGRFWSEYMKAAGYDTYFTGKWHVQADANKAFDTAVHIRGGMPRQTPQGYNRPLPDMADPWSPSDPKFGGFWEGGKHWSEVVADDAVGFLKTAEKSEKPFFMYIAFNAAHDPRQSPQEYIDKYPLEKISVPENYLAEYPYKDGIGCGPGLRDEKLGPFPRTEHAVKVHRQEYYAIVTHMDAQIGRILDQLKKSGQEQNTWIFFTADHGLAVGHHGLFGKQNMYEHSTKVPYIVAGPGVPQGEVNAQPIYLQDTMPTTLALAGVKRPDHVEFQNLLPIIQGEKETAYQSVYGAYLGLQRSVTQDGWKLIMYPKINRVRLYHLADDPREMHDLAGDAKQVKRMKSLFAEFQKLQQQTGDELDLAKAFPDL